MIPVTDAEFASVMGSIANIAIEADWHTGDDNTGLDNVVLASGGTPAVPEPSTWAMMIDGFGRDGLPVGSLGSADVRGPKREGVNPRT